MKKSIIIILLLNSCFLLFGNDITTLFDKAKTDYLRGKYAESLSTICDIENELNTLKMQNDNREIKSISLDKLYLFAEEYFKQDYRFKIEDAYINTLKVSKQYDLENTDYFIEVSNENHEIIFDIDSKKMGRLVFAIKFSLLEKLIDSIENNKIANVNIYTNGIYSIQKSQAFFSTDKYFVIEINKLELISNSDKSILQVLE